jgi:transposase
MAKSKIKAINHHAAGIDIGSEKIFVSVAGQEVKNFDTFTFGIIELSNYLKEHKITTVAMEATGVYWIPIYEVLEKNGFEVCVVNAYHVKNVPGRKSDVLDCQWIQELHTCGLLRGSFIPDDKIRGLRSYVRLRNDHVQNSASHILHIQKALNLMNIKLHNVISDVMGVSGKKIITAILNGERDPYTLVDLCDKSILNSKKELVIKSLQGNYRDEHLFLLKQAVECVEFYQGKIKDCDKEIEKLLKELTKNEDNSNTEKVISELLPPKRICSRNKPEIDGLHERLLSLCNGIDLNLIPGLTDLSVMRLVSELGTDMGKWKTEKHFVSWLNLAPQINLSGKTKKKKKRKGFNYAGQIFREAAMAAGNSKYLSISVFYKRIKAKSGAKVANVAVARKLAITFYNLLKRGIQYVEEGIEKAEQGLKQRFIKNIQKKAKELGFNVKLEPIA